MGSNLYDFNSLKGQRDPQISSTPELPLGQEPRKMVKKDPCVSINHEIDNQHEKEEKN